MLEGITVLSENTVNLFKGGIAIIILSCVGLIVCVILLNLAIRDESPAVGIWAIIASVFMIIFIIVGISDCRKGTSTKYKVTIDDTVNFKEFNNRYEIKDQDGEIYTIVEREK